MQGVVRELGREFAAHIYMDRDWLWYVGPSLQHEPEDRTKLKNLGFRFAPSGHPMQIGEKVIASNWGHSCAHPVRLFKKKRPDAAEDATETVDPNLVLAEL